MPDCAPLCPSCEELREEVRQLRELAYGTRWEPPSELGISQGQELAFLRFLVAKPGIVQNWALIQRIEDEACYRVEHHSSLEGLRVVVAKLRGKLKPYGITIENWRGEGYRMSNADRKRLLNWSKQEAS